MFSVIERGGPIWIWKIMTGTKLYLIEGKNYYWDSSSCRGGHWGEPRAHHMLVFAPQHSATLRQCKFLGRLEEGNVWNRFIVESKN